MTDLEKEMYAEKLRTEIHEYKHREATYVAKRKELLEIETAYRILQSKETGQRHVYTSKFDQQEIVEGGLTDQVKDFHRKHKLHRGAAKDVKEKIRNIDDVLGRREEEMVELKDLIQSQIEMAKKKQKDIEALKQAQ